MKAIIIGSGIAGPLAGVALHKAGIEAQVYEAYPREQALAGAGAWLTVAVNGLDAMRTLGVNCAPLWRANTPACAGPHMGGASLRRANGQVTLAPPLHSDLTMRTDPHLRPLSSSYASDPDEPEELRREHVRVNINTRSRILIVTFVMLAVVALGVLLVGLISWSHGA
jgi:hypothetical protein